MSDPRKVPGTMQDEYWKPADELIPAVYEELRKLAAHKMAAESPHHTLQPTALVHEAWLRLNGSDQSWANRAHFFAAAAEAMRRILIDIARRKAQVRHGGDQKRVELDALDKTASEDRGLLLKVHEVLDELAVIDATKAQIVKLKFFVGLANREIAELLGLSERTVERAWAFAKAWLFAAIQEQQTRAKLKSS